MRKIVMAATALGLVALAGCGKADKGEGTTADATASADAAVPFNAGLCQPGLDAHKGVNASVPAGGCVISPAKTYAMVMMSSGNLEVAAVGADGKLGAVSWSTNTRATTPGSSAAALQEDGNVVIYDQPGNKATWSSASPGALQPYHLALNDAGELLDTRVSDGMTIWSSKTGANANASKPASAEPAPAAVDAAPANAAT